MQPEMKQIDSMNKINKDWHSFTRPEESIVGLEEGNTHNIVADVSLLLKLLCITLLVRQHGRDVKHDLDVFVGSVHRLGAREIVH